MKAIYDCGLDTRCVAESITHFLYKDGKARNGLKEHTNEELINMLIEVESDIYDTYT